MIHKLLMVSYVVHHHFKITIDLSHQVLVPWHQRSTSAPLLINGASLRTLHTVIPDSPTHPSSASYLIHCAQNQPPARLSQGRPSARLQPRNKTTKFQAAALTTPPFLSPRHSDHHNSQSHDFPRPRRPQVPGHCHQEHPAHP